MAVAILRPVAQRQFPMEGPMDAVPEGEVVDLIVDMVEEGGEEGGPKHPVPAEGEDQEYIVDVDCP